MTSRADLPNKLIGETKDYFVDFASLLTSGETISSAVVTAAVYSGEDSTPSAIVDGAATSSGSIVTQSITAGTLGVIYDTLWTIVTSSGETLQISGLIAVVPPQ